MSADDTMIAHRRPRRPHRRRRAALAAVAMLSAALPGCTWLRSLGSGGDGTPAAQPAATRPVSTESTQIYTGPVPGVLQPVNRPIVQGPLPLFYLVESPMTLRVVNADTNEEVTTVDVKPPQILRVEPRGVVLDRDAVLGARLAPGNYAIYQLSDNAGVVRTTQTRSQATIPPPHPAETAPPASQPAAEPSAAPPADTPPPQ